MSDERTHQRVRLIGGVIGLPARVPELAEPNGQNWLCRHSRALRLVNARSAFYLLGQTLRPRKAWLPSYLCEAVVQGFRAAAVPVEFFPVNDQLRCADSAWLDRVQRDDLVLRISYFGFLNRDPVFAEAIGRGAWLADDAAQALLTEGIGDAASFVVFSPRKFIGVPDGGCLVPMTSAPVEWPALQPVPAAWWEEALAAVQLRRDFDLGADSREWFPKFQKAEQTMPIGAFAMSEFSGHLLDQGFDFSAIARIRRANYLQLLIYLRDFALFRDLPDGVVPLGFPVRVRNRDAVRQELFQDQIYPPVHWALDGVLPESFAASHNLARTMMTLPCDQRYTNTDCERMAKAFIRATSR